MTRSVPAAPYACATPPDPDPDAQPAPGVRQVAARRPRTDTSDPKDTDPSGVKEILAASRATGGHMPYGFIWANASSTSSPKDALQEFVSS